MKTNLFESYLKQRAEEMAPATNINLMPGILTHFSSKQSVLPFSTGGLRMKHSLNTITILLTVALALTLALGFFIATPAGSTWAQEFIALFFNKAPDSRPFDADDGTPVITPVASIAEGEAMTGWHIYQPTWLPDGFVFYDTEYRPNADCITQSYGYQKTIGMVSSYFFIGQRKSPFNELWPVGESSLIETVQIGDTTGEYVIGVWGGAGDHLEWEALPQFQHLRWQKDGTYFDLEFAMFGVDAKDLTKSPYYLTKDQLITLAANMK